MALRQLRRPIRLILDYDGTLTIKDTMSVLGTLPKQPKMSWEEIVAAYLKDYATYKQTPYPWKKYDREEYSGWLASRKWVERKSAQRVQESAFFRGVTVEDVSSAVGISLEKGELELRKGWEALFELFLPAYNLNSGAFHDSSIEVLSVNWSETAIRQALWQTAEESKHPHQKLLSHVVNDIKITANEIEGLASPYGSCGRVIRPFDADIRTSGDKLGYVESSALPAGPEIFTVYVGDSSTDFDALCAADLGIWLCDVAEAEYQKASKDVFKPLDFIPPPLKSLSSLANTPALFYWASDLQSVVDILAQPQQ